MKNGNSKNGVAVTIGYYGHLAHLKNQAGIIPSFILFPCDRVGEEVKDGKAAKQAKRLFEDVVQQQHSGLNYPEKIFQTITTVAKVEKPKTMLVLLRSEEDFKKACADFGISANGKMENAFIPVPIELPETEVELLN